jgi:hypothetical protein
LHLAQGRNHIRSLLSVASNFNSLLASQRPAADPVLAVAVAAVLSDKLDDVGRQPILVIAARRAGATLGGRQRFAINLRK